MKLDFVFLFLLLFSITSSSARDQWVFLGDSLTVGAIGNGDVFEREVKQRFGRDIEVINKSRIGKHSYEYRDEIDSILAQYPRAQYFPIFCGVNDVLHYSGGAANQLRGWLLYVLRAIQKAGRTPILMRITYRDYKGQDPLSPFNAAVYDPLIKEYSPRWYDFAKGKGSLDPHGFLKARPSYLASDGVHLSSSGYRAFRKEILLEAMMSPVYGAAQKSVEQKPAPTTRPSLDDLVFDPRPTGQVNDFVAPVQNHREVPDFQDVPQISRNEELKQEILDAGSSSDPIKKGIYLWRASEHLEKLKGISNLSNEYSDDIRAFQRALQASGRAGVKESGVYDLRTRAAVQSLRVWLAQSYLKKRGLYRGPISGVLDRKTRASLKEYAANRFLEYDEFQLLRRIIRRMAK